MTRRCHVCFQFLADKGEKSLEFLANLKYRSYFLNSWSFKLSLSREITCTLVSKRKLKLVPCDCPLLILIALSHSVQTFSISVTVSFTHQVPRITVIRISINLLLFVQGHICCELTSLIIIVTTTIQYEYAYCRYIIYNVLSYYLKTN